MIDETPTPHDPDGENGRCYSCGRVFNWHTGLPLLWSGRKLTAEEWEAFERENDMTAEELQELYDNLDEDKCCPCFLAELGFSLESKADFLSSN